MPFHDVRPCSDRRDRRRAFALCAIALAGAAALLAASRNPSELEDVAVFLTGGALLGLLVWQGQRTRVAEETAAARRESERRYRLLFERNPQPMWVYDNESLRFLAVSDTAVRHYGYSREEFLSMSIRDIRPEEDVPALEHTIAESEGGLQTTSGWCHRRKDGSIIDVEIFSDGIDFGGRPARLVIAQDVTERKRAEGQLRESRRRLAEAQRLAHLGSWEWDIDADVISWSDEQFRIYGADGTAGPASFAAWLERVHVDDRERVREIVDRALGQGEPFEIEFRVVRPDGEERILHSHGQPVVEGPRRLVGVSQDVTDRRRAEAALPASEERARETERLESVGQVAGGLAHDFNNLLGVILNYTDFVAEALPADSPVRADAKEIRRAAESAAVLTRRLLIFSRRQPVDPAVLDLNELIAGLENLVRSTVGEHVEVRTRLEPGLPAMLADGSQLEHVLLNLAINARDAMSPAGGRLEIDTANVAGCVQLRVADTGCGMPEEVAARVFEPFFTTKPDGLGTGLGLATVYGAVQQAGGTIELDSRVGEGTTFTLRFPVCEDALTGRDAGPSLEVGEPQDRTILVVEDEPAVRDFTQRILEAHGFRVLAAGPDDALTVLDRHDGALDLLLADLVMPGTSGPQLAERLLELRPGTPVLYMSGYGEDFALRSGMMSAADALLAKPFGADALLERIHAALGAAERLPEAA